MELLEELKELIRIAELNPETRLIESSKIIDLERLTNLAIEIGILAKKYNVANTDYKFPTEPLLVEIYNDYIKLLDLVLPVDSLKDYSNLIHIGTPICEFFSQINMICQIGEYIDPGGLEGRRKKELLCKIAKLGLIVEKQKKAISEGKSNDQLHITDEEYDYLKNLYSEYMLIENKENLKTAVQKVFKIIENEYSEERRVIW